MPSILLLSAVGCLWTFSNVYFDGSALLADDAYVVGLGEISLFDVCNETTNDNNLISSQTRKEVALIVGHRPSRRRMDEKK